MKEIDVAVSEVIRRTYNVKSFRFGVLEPVEFKPGQYMLVTVPVDGQPQTKALSISNSPTEGGYVECTKKITDSPFSRTLDRLAAGARARLKLPLGSFTFTGEYEKIALLSGGVGITPLRSISQYASDKKLPTDIVLIYSNSTERDIIFRDDFDQMQKTNGNFRVVHTLTGHADGGKPWSGRVGYINESVIREEMPDYRDRMFFLCGPPKMVEAMKTMLEKDLALSQDRIKTENFAGY